LKSKLLNIKIILSDGHCKRNIKNEPRRTFTLLKGFITEVIGAEFVEEMDITPESSFTKDLEMDSIRDCLFL
jgi:hypothetical protein